MQMVSALDGCLSDDGTLKPAFLKFQLGPVQDFIQSARSTRDLWSGSYLLSWLMARGLAALALRVGPDAVIFPNLRDQPLLDLALKGAVWDQVKINGQPLWASHESLNWSKEELLTPNLPNVFLAIVPADQAQELGALVVQTVQDEWKQIAESVWTHCEKNSLWQIADDLPPLPERVARFHHQIDNFLSLSWAVTEWPDTLEKIEDLARGLPESGAQKNFATVKAAAEAIRRIGHQDERYFTSDGKLNNYGIGWAILSALSSWQLDAVKQTRIFAPGSTGAIPGRHQIKDSLTGKEEAVAGGPAWLDDDRFKHDGDYLAAPTLVKRLWDKSYLHTEWKESLGPQPHPMPNTRDLAAHRPEEDSADDDSPADAHERYFAVLAFDGDEMGKWISGEKTPAFSAQLADYEGGGALEYFQHPERAAEFQSFLNTPRPLSPGYHLQFSECLSNFALRCVLPIVEAHDGRLIYAGGDDVVALLPADAALACANDLQLAFRSETPVNTKTGLRQKAPGFLVSESFHEKSGKQDSKNEALIPFMVPGPAATASVGIAIAHFKSPLQDVVRAAKAAEKRAKNQLGRAAVAVSLFKRSGEITEWGCQWKSQGIALYEAIAALLDEGDLSGKFPHRVCELLEPYRTHLTGLSKQDDATGIDATDLITREFNFAIERQSSAGKKRTNADRLIPILTRYLDALTVLHGTSSRDEKVSLPQFLFKSVIGLSTTAAFAHRTRSETEKPKGN